MSEGLTRKLSNSPLKVRPHLKVAGEVLKNSLVVDEPPGTWPGVSCHVLVPSSRVKL